MTTASAEPVIRFDEQFWFGVITKAERLRELISESEKLRTDTRTQAIAADPDYIAGSLGERLGSGSSVEEYMPQSSPVPSQRSDSANDLALYPDLNQKVCPMPQKTQESSRADGGTIDPQRERFRFAVGRIGGTLQRTQPYRGVTVFGPVRSGKTTGVIVPALARQRVRTITISVRGDVINATLPVRWRTDPVWVVDPMGMLPDHRTIGWTLSAFAGLEMLVWILRIVLSCRPR